MKEKILIIEDEKDIVKMLEYNLQKEGFRTIYAYDGEDGLRLAQREYPDLMLLDLMLPGKDGLEICKIIKKDDKISQIPIIMLTAKSQEIDKIIGLEFGADDYVTKPFSLRELVARVKAVLRRSQDKNLPLEIQKIGSLEINFSKITVLVGGKKVELTSKEFELLKTLLNARGRVLSRDFLLDTVWGFDNAVNIQTRTVDVHIRSLRKKIGQESKRIVTVKNYGYRFELEK